MSVNLVMNIGADGIRLAEFVAEAQEQGLVHAAATSWTTGVTLADVDREAIASFVGDHGWQAVYDLEDECVAFVGVDHDNAYVHVAATSSSRAAEGLAQMRELVPAGDTAEANQIPVTFWAYNPRGPLQIRRNLDAPSWDDIEGNYTQQTRERLERLLFSFVPGRGGQLILWAGKPGTGKTTAIRALAREWREWAEVHYVTDPDKFFGSEADYMLSVLLEDGERVLRSSTDGAPVERWRVLLLEDAGELLQADARERTGQGLSRFLNAVDGLIGQGLRVLVLVTTNEDVRKLNPAVARPGRCAANVEFGPLDHSEAAAWLKARGENVAGMDLPGQTLAELFAIVEGFEGESVSRPLGFVSEATA